MGYGTPQPRLWTHCCHPRAGGARARARLRCCYPVPPPSAFSRRGRASAAQPAPDLPSPLFSSGPPHFPLQDDPAAPHKLQESLKPCTKEEESFNIQNSTSPKHDSGKGEPDEAEVNCLQNNLT